MMRTASAVALCAVLAVLIASARTVPVTWETLLAPYASGTPVSADLRITDMRRGAANDVVLVITRPGEPVGVQVHILPRGAWPDVRVTQSFSIGYETPHSPAPERDAVTETIAQTIRARDQGLPSPGAIPLRAADITGLPWWLEALRGARGRAIGGVMILLALLIIPTRDFVSPARWGRIKEGAGAHPESGALSVSPSLARERRVSRPALALLAVALLLRLGLGPWGPLHVNGQGPRFVAGAACDSGDIALYGPGYAEIFAPIAALAPANPDWAVFAFNAVLSAGAVPLAYTVARLAGVDAAVAFAAAAVLALDPISIRMGATEAYFMPIITLCLAAAAVLLGGGKAAANGRLLPTVAPLAAGALLLGQAARLHPSAWGLVACTPFVILAAPGLRAAQRARALCAALVLIAGVCIAMSGDILLDVFANIRGGTLMRPMPPHSLTPLYVIAVLALAYTILAPCRWLAVPAALCAAAGLATRHGYDQSWLWQQAYDRLYLTLPLVAAIAIVPPTVLRQRWLTGLIALAVGALWIQQALPIVRARTTDHLEYRWLRQQIAALPAQCRIVHLISAEKRVLAIPSYVPVTRPATAIDLRQSHTLAAALAPAPCTYYVRSSLCASPEAQASCAELERHLQLEPAAQTNLPAIPSSHLLSYTQDPVEVSLARVRDEQ